MTVAPAHHVAVPRPVQSFPPRAAFLSEAEKRRQKWQEDRVRLLRACRLLRMALGFDRRPGGDLADKRPPPSDWIVRALAVVAEDCILSVDRPGVDKALEALASRNALAALLCIEEEALRLRR